MKSSLGQYGELYQRDEQGRISQITYLGADGNPAPTTAGYTVLKRTYHRDGTADIDMYFDADSNPMALSKGQYGIKRSGKVNLLLDKNGRVMLCVDNVLNGLPFMVVIFGCVICLLILVLPKKMSVLLTAAYIAFILYETLMFREAGDARTNFVLFSYADRFLTEQSVRVGVINNIWLFVPLGAGWYRIIQKKWVLLVPFLMSVVIEATQYITGLGIAEFDDVFGNTLGGWIGVLTAWVLYKEIFNMKKHRVFSLFTVIFVAFLLFQSVTIVPTGYTGVKTSFGQIQEATIQSGKLNFTIPFVQSIHTVSNKQQDKHIEAQIWGEASDKTPVYAADVIVTYQVLPEKSAWLYANVSDTKNLVGDELVASAIKSAMAELGPNEVTNRTKIEPLAQQKLAESLNQKYGEGAVFINKVVINNMDFEEAYNTAIQQKSIAQQNADKQKIENEAAIAKAEADKQVAITNAEAEAQKTSIAADAQAEANRKIAESLSDTLIEYQKIQKWDGKLPTVSGSNALVSIDPAE